MTNIVLCGGNGTRLWPLSRKLMPKQFIKLFDEKSLFQLTIERNDVCCSKKLIISNTEQYFLALDQIEELDNAKLKTSHNTNYYRESSTFLLEPIGKNTAPAIALACFSLNLEDVVLVSPSDHLIKDSISYEKVLLKAEKLAQEGFLVTFGIKPRYAETGFGYIEADGTDVKAFHEKPDESTAQKYLKAGNYYWNSGIFCFKAGVFLEELKKYSPEIYEMAKLAYESSKEEKDIIRINYNDMIKIPEDSIDYAVMENSKIVKVVIADFGWNDLGSFDALYEELPKDENGNTLNSDYISIDSKNNLVFCDTRKIATIDIENTIIVDTGDAILISKKGSSQKVKKVVEEIKKDTELHNIHLTAHRPWGTYTVLEDTPGYKIKKIVVKPGKRLSLQKHFHRSEHWIVVSGTATVTVGDRKYLVRPNESTYIKMGEVHRLENEGKIDVVLIEAQVGEYTGEDDIVRIEDDFKRF
ncbi:mannose-1-phosphate guanylyltransferase/mannose-6-phosphate isomerase [Hydrogenimonas thermophila]|uniref:mannose-1-phosphate guanylyltransferase n=1 Tax=Hydrogenimonas thermophila TaxID=223786 RepID=A0A1I5KS94_9BACT|nr:mannose-1-phosphate guanylyltransferase/mannose-6-phosphate isomerase [Hydrogenimonas thermophila]SFO87812.1 mannose-1-phosphate guanylyltransferase [Hydrogenimonas thermophila]